MKKVLAGDNFARKEVVDFMETIRGLYDFFKLSNVRKLYDGQTLKRLIETRWSGHLLALRIIKRNYQKIKSALEQATTARSLKPEQRASARGYLEELIKPTNIYLLHFLSDILESMEHLTQSFQTINTSIMACLDVLESVRLDLENHKATYTESHILSLITTGNNSSSSVSIQHRDKRQRTLPSHLTDSVVTCAMPQFRNLDGHNHSSICRELRGLTVDIIDAFNNELDGRFSDDNVRLWDAFQCLSPLSNRNNFLDADKLLPLLEFAFTIPIFKGDRTSGKLGDTLEDASDDLRSECRLFKTMLLQHFDTLHKDESLLFAEKLLQFVNSRPSIRILRILYHVAITAGYSTSTAECVFSARKRIDTHCRRKLTPYKQGGLTVLHFEKSITGSITFEEFLNEWKKKPRKLRV